MVTVTQSTTGELLYLKAHFYYSERIKHLPSAQWNPDLKVWSIRTDMISYLENEFDGELFYKTPRWFILHEPMPDFSNLYTIPDNIKAPDLVQPYKLYDYQIFGIRFAIDRINKYGFCIIADGVGLGKTNQGIGMMIHMAQQGKQKFIIVCKKSIKHQWKEEIEKFSTLGQTYDIFITGDTAAKRKKAYKGFENAQCGILITNYQSFLNDEAELSQLQYDFVCIDEAHVVSSHTTKTNKAMTRVLNSVPCLYLTGTPIQSKPEQIFGIVNITSPGYFGSWTKFKNKFVVEAFMGTHTQTIGAKNLDELRQMIQDVMIRRTEYEVSVQLPSTVEQQVMCPCDNTQIDLIQAINTQREQYLSQYEALQQKYHKNPDHNTWQQMQQCDALIKGLIAAGQATADDPRLFHTTRSAFLKKNFEQLIPGTYKMSSKMESLIDIVENIVDSGDKCIIFSKFTTAIDLIQAELLKKLKINALTYTGREDDATRIFNTNAFKTMDEYPVLIGSEAMAEGLNLQVAKYVINFNLPDTAAIYTQRIGRARRVGSAFNNVIVYNLITEGSKDEARWKNIEDNKNLEDSLINIDQAQQAALLNAMNT